MKNRIHSLIDSYVKIKKPCRDIREFCIEKNGIITYYRKFKYYGYLIHREDGPSLISKHAQTWFKRGLIHRDNDLPAVEYTNGTKVWYQNNLMHRKDKPAIEYSDESKEIIKEIWMSYGSRHRLDGPAVTYKNGKKEWWINGLYQKTEQV